MEDWKRALGIKNDSDYSNPENYEQLNYDGRIMICCPAAGIYQCSIGTQAPGIYSETYSLHLQKSTDQSMGG